MSKKITTDIFIRMAKKTHGNKYDYSKVTYESSTEKVCIICPEHGEFWQTPHNHLCGKGCIKCGIMNSKRKQAKTFDDFVSDAVKVHGDKYDYSKVDYENAKTKVEIICPEHGEFWQRPDDHLRGKTCPICGKEQRKKTNLIRYGGSAPICSNEVKEKIKMTLLDRYGVEHALQSDYIKSKIDWNDLVDKAIITKYKNNTLNSSSLQNLLGDLLVDYFGNGDILFEYNKDKRYPFHCDFYVKSKDLFIELNGFWTHNDHWFDETNESDIKQLNEWYRRDESDSYGVYSGAIETWTIRDVKKRNYACKNNLNYVVFWGDCKNEIDEWFKAGCPIRKDWK